MFLSILKADKQDDDESQRLICAKDRGGLWKLNSNGQTIFKTCEIEFRERQNEFKKNCSININELKNTLLYNSSLLSHYSNIYNSFNPKVSK